MQAGGQAGTWEPVEVGFRIGMVARSIASLACSTRTVTPVPANRTLNEKYVK
jgi:hypothetical protein